MADLPKNPEQAEAEHLAALNEGLVDIAHPFTSIDLRMEGDRDVNPLVETKRSIDVGDNHIQAIINASFPKSDGTFNHAVFTPLFHKEKSWKNDGAMHIVEATVDDAVPAYQPEEIKQGDNTKLGKLNRELIEITSTLPGKKYRKLEVPDLVEYEIHDVNPGRFVTISCTNTKGERFPVILNTMDSHTGMEGHIFVAEFPKSGDYAFLEQPKPIVGQKKIGPPQGFAGPLDSDGATYQGLRDELGVDLLSASLQTILLEEDLRTCLVDDRFFLLHLNTAHEKVLNRADLLQNMEIQLDKLAKIRMSKKDTFDAIKEGRINGAHAVAGVALASINRGDVRLNPSIDTVNNGIWLNRIRPAFDSNKERLSLFRGSVGLGKDIGKTFADPTKFRDVTPIRLVKQSDISDTNVVFVSYAELFNVLKGGNGFRSDLGVVETASLLTYALQKDIFVPNFK